jgi:hypothetical protein
MLVIQSGVPRFCELHRVVYATAEGSVNTVGFGRLVWGLEFSRRGLHMLLYLLLSDEQVVKSDNYGGGSCPDARWSELASQLALQAWLQMGTQRLGSIVSCVVKVCI